MSSTLNITDIGLVDADKHGKLIETVVRKHDIGFI